MQDQTVQVRCIEPMPLQGAEKLSEDSVWSYDVTTGYATQTAAVGWRRQYRIRYPWV